MKTSSFGPLLVAALATLCAASGCRSDATVDSGSPVAGDMASAPFTGSGLMPDEIPLVVDQVCPGGPKCADSGDGKLYAGTAKRDVTPLVEPFVDTNGNGTRDDDESYTDLNGNGRFDPVYMAGYGKNRLAFGVHDPTWVRCIALRQNETTLVTCAVDCVGFFQNDQAQIRADLDPALGVDLLMMAGTHLHETQDTIGIWGSDFSTTGIDPAYMKRIRQLTVEAVSEAVKGMRPAKMSIAMVRTQDDTAMGPDFSPYVADSRDPVVIDNRMHLLQFDGADDGKPIVTVLNFAAHPESAGSDNHFITSDYVFWLRDSVEQGTGSDVVFINGPLGGQIGPGGVHPYDFDNPTERVEHRYGFKFAQAWGLGLARIALKGVKALKPVTAPKLSFRHTTFEVHVENFTYQVAGKLGLFKREFYGFDRSKPLIRNEEFDNVPRITTEAAYVELGPAAISTCPAELLPENFVGGYDGSFAGGYRFIDTMRKNAPDPAKAPKPPYLIDLMGGEPEHRMVWGLTLDFLGYVIPRYNFVLHEVAPYIGEAEGDHYEETTSIGSRAEPEIVGSLRQLAMSATGKKP